MKADGKYRFNLQFPAETQEQIQAGEFLERAGNRKSLLVVEAITAYLYAHPELLKEEGYLKISTTQTVDRNAVEQMIRNVVREYFLSHPEMTEKKTSADSDDELDADISQMLDNLELFQ